MLYHLFFRFASEFSAFNVFRYITFRTGAATLTALFIAFMVGPPLIRWLERMRVLVEPRQSLHLDRHWHHLGLRAAGIHR